MEQKEPTVAPAEGNLRFYWGQITDHLKAGRQPNKHSYKITLPQHTLKKKKKRGNKHSRKISTQFLTEGHGALP